MPMYEYRCKDCGTVNEFLVGVSSDEPEIVCDSCGGSKLARMLSVMSFTMGSSGSHEAAACACGGHGNAGACGSGSCACETA